MAILTVFVPRGSATKLYRSVFQCQPYGCSSHFDLTWRSGGVLQRQFYCHAEHSTVDVRPEAFVSIEYQASVEGAAEPADGRLSNRPFLIFLQNYADICRAFLPVGAARAERTSCHGHRGNISCLG